MLHHRETEGEGETRLTYVRDHLLNMLIPVRYIEEGAETALDDFDQLAALAATRAAKVAELEAMEQGFITHLDHEARRAAKEAGSDDYVFDLENAAFDDLTALEEMIGLHALDITRGAPGSTGAPMRRVLELA